MTPHESIGHTFGQYLRVGKVPLSPPAIQDRFRMQNVDGFTRATPWKWRGAFGPSTGPLMPFLMIADAFKLVALAAILHLKLHERRNARRRGKARGPRPHSKGGRCRAASAPSRPNS